MMTIIG